MKKVRLMNRKK